MFLLALALTAFALSEKHRTWLEEEVVYLIRGRKKEVFQNLGSDEERFIEAFWEARDPTSDLDSVGNLNPIELWFYEQDNPRLPPRASIPFFGFAAGVIVALCNMPLALIFYDLFKPVNRSLESHFPELPSTKKSGTLGTRQTPQPAGAGGVSAWRLAPRT